MEEIDDNPLRFSYLADVVAVAMIELKGSHLGSHRSPSSILSTLLGPMPGIDPNSLRFRDASPSTVSIPELLILRASEFPKPRLCTDVTRTRYPW